MNASDLNENDALADITTRMDFYTMVVSGSVAIFLAAVTFLLPPEASDSFIEGLVQRFLICSAILFCSFLGFRVSTLSYPHRSANLYHNDKSRFSPDSITGTVS